MQERFLVDIIPLPLSLGNRVICSPGTRGNYQGILPGNWVWQTHGVYDRANHKGNDMANALLIKGR